MLKITGYSDQISVSPGDKIKFHVNCEHKSYKAELVRVVSGDNNPKGPGIIEPAVKSSIDGSYRGRKQEIHAGSYAWVKSSAVMEKLGSFAVQAHVWPTTPLKGAQGIITKWNGPKKSGFALVIDEKGAVALKLGDGKGKVSTVSAGKPMVGREWYFVGASYNAQTKEVHIYQEPRDEYATIDDRANLKMKVAPAPASSDVPLVIGAWCKAARGEKGIICDGHMNGKVDSPRLIGDAISRARMETLRGGPVPTSLATKVIGAWDFSKDISEATITDISPNRLHGEVVNMPTRGVLGYNWTGDELCWRHAPEQYGAIHFHDDDVYDAQWDVDFELTVPDGLKSGVYAAKCSAGEDVEYMPFVVRAKPGKEKKAAYIFPSASYMAYANEHFATNPWAAEIMTHRATELWPHSIFLNEHREYGHSCYDYHSDGSGVAITSRLRPILNMRPRVQTVLGGDGSQLWQFNADTHLLVWLEKLNFEYDVITDEDMHYNGIAALKPYNVIMTGTHPEYYSKSMYDAVFDYTKQGGRLMYLGGNGFYWRVSFHKTKPGVLELRRTEGGSRAWAPKSGEYYTGFTGEYSGLWRRQGRTGPNVIAGVGFAAEGFDISTYYRRNPDSFNKRAKWIFEGVGKDELIGNFGYIGGGAAGLEVDRADRGFGTPPHALNLASSENHTDTYLQVVEDIFFNYPGTGGQENENVRGDIVFYEMPNGGAVFSTSSMAWCGSLPWNDCKNNVSKITENVLRRFMDSKPF